MTESAQRRLIIAIDGPAGAGKSTIASALSKRLGYTNLETGAMYRALGLKALENGVSPDDEPALYALAERSVIDLLPTPNGNRVLLDQRDITALIRAPEVSDAASRVSVHPNVRRWMVDRQREMGASGGIVMEGRDIGTAVFPNADVKIFLDANPDIRAQRRLSQDSNKPGPAKSAEVVAAEMRQRDERDRSRATSPLAPAPDAVILDSSGLTIEQVVNRAEEIVQRKLRQLTASAAQPE
ncbi:MAG TPA: (d)CMP kinase [Terriglobales bacterium]|nr:(d)CMP kinase [Terriglobales bacterium]